MRHQFAVNVTVAVLLGGLFFCAMSTLPGRAAERCGAASYYCCEHHGRLTASGARFNQNAMTAAMPNRSEMGRVYRVTHGGKSVKVTITDLGPHKSLNRVIDLSKAAFARLAPTSRGVIRVCLERVR